MSLEKVLTHSHCCYITHIIGQNENRREMKRDRFLLLSVLVLLSLTGNVKATTWCVATNGADTNPGTNWASPFLTISNGIAHAVGGDTVQVSNGTYNITVLISVGTNITVESVSGPDVTIVRRDAVGDAEPRIGIFELTHTNALVAGFTMTNGYGHQEEVRKKPL